MKEPIKLTPEKGVELLKIGLPYPEQMKNIDLSKKGSIYFTWRGTRYKLDLEYCYVMASRGMFLEGDDASLLMTQCLEAQFEKIQEKQTPAIPLGHVRVRFYLNECDEAFWSCLPARANDNDAFYIDTFIEEHHEKTLSPKVYDYLTNDAPVLYYIHSTWGRDADGPYQQIHLSDIPEKP